MEQINWFKLFKQSVEFLAELATPHRLPSKISPRKTSQAHRPAPLQYGTGRKKWAINCSRPIAIQKAKAAFKQRSKGKSFACFRRYCSASSGQCVPASQGQCVPSFYGQGAHIFQFYGRKHAQVRQDEEYLWPVQAKNWLQHRAHVWHKLPWYGPILQLVNRMCPPTSLFSNVEGEKSLMALQHNRSKCAEPNPARCASREEAPP